MSRRKKVRGLAPIFSNPAYARPASTITDRAKRYRAHHPDVVPDLSRCGFCGSKRHIVPHHINGDESDTDAQNLMPACKSCNAFLAVVMKRAGVGVPTKQYNPAVRKGSRSDLMREYGNAIKVMRGEFEGDVAKAVRTIRATPRDVRSAYTSRSWSARRQIYGPSGRQGRLFGDEVPF